MSILHTPFFASSALLDMGVGFHNVGSSGLHRATNDQIVKKIEHYYGERCGHLPLTARNVRLLVETPNDAIHSQMVYLSHLFGKKMQAVGFSDLYKEVQISGHSPLVVPYLNAPETEQLLHETLGANIWGLPGKMVQVLKNKAMFHQLVDELQLEGVFTLPHYTATHIRDVTCTAWRFLHEIENLYTQAGLSNSYPLGIVLRSAESEGSYCCCLIYEQEGRILIINGDADSPHYCANWSEALEMAQKFLLEVMNLQEETRVILSRYLDMLDSPGLSLVILDGQVESLGWNGQLQMGNSKACLGTSSYKPKSKHLLYLQQKYEEETASFFATLLKKTAEKCGLEFAKLRGIANIDLMLPSELELHLRRANKQKAAIYIAECNPRWTNYTDAIMTVLGATQRVPTVHHMRAVIEEGIFTVDKHNLPDSIDPRMIRERLLERNEHMRHNGARVICRVTNNPMGLIFTGNIQRASQCLASIVQELGTASL
ncbi:MAG: hypothetical protein JO125_02075 [Chloroflexi bacterium]|nr:hypothetical protein [Chloroflexota bacterium]